MSQLNLLGFNGPAPHSIIYWQQGGEDQSKTVCYTPDDEKWALDRFNTAGDFYYKTYDKAVVDYGDEIVNYPHSLRKGA